MSLILILRTYLITWLIMKFGSKTNAGKNKVAKIGFWIMIAFIVLICGVECVIVKNPLPIFGEIISIIITSVFYKKFLYNVKENKDAKKLGKIKNDIKNDKKEQSSSNIKIIIVVIGIIIILYLIKGFMLNGDSVKTNDIKNNTKTINNKVLNNGDTQPIINKGIDNLTPNNGLSNNSEDNNEYTIDDRELFVLYKECSDDAFKYMNSKNEEDLAIMNASRYNRKLGCIVARNYSFQSYDSDWYEVYYLTVIGNNLENHIYRCSYNSSKEGNKCIDEFRSKMNEYGFEIGKFN